jgi:hypothetical protein
MMLVEEKEWTADERGGEGRDENAPTPFVVNVPMTSCKSPSHSVKVPFCTADGMLASQPTRSNLFSQ